MTSKVKGMLTSVIVLCIIAATSGLLLGLVNKITYINPETEALNKFEKLSDTKAQFEMIEKDKDNVLYYAKSKELNPVSAYLAVGGGGYGGNVEMYVFIRDNKIYKIVQGNNSETFFSVVEDAQFYKSFYEKDLSAITSFPLDKKNLVSGATKTSTAVTNAINNAIKFHKKNTVIDTPLVDVTVDLTNYKYIKKVQQDSQKKYYITFEGKITPLGNNITLKFAAVYYNGIIQSVTDKTTSDNYFTATTSAFVKKGKEEIVGLNITSDATESNSKLKEMLLEGFTLIETLGGKNNG